MVTETAVCLLILFILWAAYLNISDKLNRAPPGPFRLPLLGNLLQATHYTEYPRFLLQMNKDYGKICRFYIGTQMSVVVSDRQLIKQVCVDNWSKYVRHMRWRDKLVYGSSKDVPSFGFSSGESYLVKKRLLFDTLNNDISMQRTQGVIETELGVLVNRLIEFARAGEPVNVVTILNKYHSSVTYKTLLSMTDTENPEFFSLMRSVSELRVGLQKPSLGDSIPILRIFDKQLLNTIKEFTAVRDCAFMEILLRKKESLNPNNPRDIADEMLLNEMEFTRVGAALMELMIGQVEICDLLTSVVIFHCLETNHRLASKQVNPQVFNQACQITSPYNQPSLNSYTTLQRALGHLAGNPEYQIRARDEILSLGKDYLNIAKLDTLPFFQALMKENIRIWPIVPIPPLELLEDGTIGGYHLPKNTVIWPNNVALWADSAWGGDHEKYRPERWLEPGVDSLERDFYLPFGIGARQCPAIRLVKTEMALLFASLLKNFDLIPKKSVTQQDAGIFVGFWSPTTTPQILFRYRVV